MCPYSAVCSACAVCVAVVVEVVGRWTGSFCLYHQHRGIISLASFDEDGDDHITWHDVATGPASQGGL